MKYGGSGIDVLDDLASLIADKIKDNITTKKVLMIMKKMYKN